MAWRWQWEWRWQWLPSLSWLLLNDCGRVQSDRLCRWTAPFGKGYRMYTKFAYEIEPLPQETIDDAIREDIMSPLELWRFTTRKNWLGTTYSTRVFNSLWQEADFRSWLSGYLEGYVCDFFGPFSSHSSPFHSSVLTFVNYSFTNTQTLKQSNNQTIKHSHILYASSPRSFFMAISTPISWIPTGRTWLYQKNWFTSCKLSWIGLARMLHLLPRKS